MSLQAAVRHLQLQASTSAPGCEDHTVWSSSVKGRRHEGAIRVDLQGVLAIELARDQQGLGILVVGVELPEVQKWVGSDVFLRGLVPFDLDLGGMSASLV